MKVYVAIVRDGMELIVAGVFSNYDDAKRATYNEWCGVVVEAEVDNEYSIDDPVIFDFRGYGND